MPFSEKEMREDLRQVRIRMVIYLLGGLGILGLSVTLVVIFIVKQDWPAILLAAVGLFWCVVLAQQTWRTRRLESLIRQRSENDRAEVGARDEP